MDNEYAEYPCSTWVEGNKECNCDM